MARIDMTFLSRLRTLHPGTRENRVLRVGLLTILAVLVAKAFMDTIPVASRLGTDLEISLRAADRWMVGVTPYVPLLAASPGPSQPFLYPPYTLPFISVLAAVPRELIITTWVSAMLLAAVFACRRLAIPLGMGGARHPVAPVLGRDHHGQHPDRALRRVHRPLLSAIGQQLEPSPP